MKEFIGADVKDFLRGLVGEVPMDAKEGRVRKFIPLAKEMIQQYGREVVYESASPDDRTYDTYPISQRFNADGQDYNIWLRDIKRSGDNSSHYQIIMRNNNTPEINVYDVSEALFWVAGGEASEGDMDRALELLQFMNYCLWATHRSEVKSFIP